MSNLFAWYIAMQHGCIKKKYIYLINICPQFIWNEWHKSQLHSPLHLIHLSMGAVQIDCLLSLLTACRHNSESTNQIRLKLLTANWFFCKQQEPRFKEKLGFISANHIIRAYLWLTFVIRSTKTGKMTPARIRSKNWNRLYPLMSSW